MFRLFLLLLVTALSLHNFSFSIEPEELAKKQCRSVHVRHGAVPEQSQAIYTEAVILKSAPGTYFAASTFDDGYIGVQEVADGKRVVIFSIWDAVAHGDDPGNVPDNHRVELLATGDGINSRRFGGEGTGGNSMGPLEWKEKKVIKFLVISNPSQIKSGYKVIRGYVNTGNKWQLISAWRTTRSKQEFSQASSFVEDFKRNYESTKYERAAIYGPCFVLTAESQWLLLNRGTFTADPTPSLAIQAEVMPNRYGYLIATGGKLQMKDWKLWESRIMPITAQKPSIPGVDVEKIIHDPFKEPKEGTLDGAKPPNSL